MTLARFITGPTFLIQCVLDIYEVYEILGEVSESLDYSSCKCELSANDCTNIFNETTTGEIVVNCQCRYAVTQRQTSLNIENCLEHSYLYADTIEVGAGLPHPTVCRENN